MKHYCGMCGKEFEPEYIGQKYCNNCEKYLDKREKRLRKNPISRKHNLRKNSTTSRIKEHNRRENIFNNPKKKLNKSEKTKRNPINNKGIPEQQNKPIEDELTIQENLPNMIKRLLLRDKKE